MLGKLPRQGSLQPWPLICRRRGVNASSQLIIRQQLYGAWNAPSSLPCMPAPEAVRQQGISRHVLQDQRGAACKIALTCLEQDRSSKANHFLDNLLLCNGMSLGIKLSLDLLPDSRLTLPGGAAGGLYRFRRRLYCLGGMCCISRLQYYPGT